MQSNIKEGITNSKLNRFHVFITAICMFIVMAEGYSLVIFGSIKNQLVIAWNLDSVVIGMLGSAALVGMMVGSLVLGILSDIVGRKQMMIACLAFFSIFTGLAGFATSPFVFVAFYFLAGIGIGGAMPNAMGLLSDFVPKKSRNTLIATAMAGMQLGGILAPLSALAFGESGWRTTLWMAFLPLLAIPVIIFKVPNAVDYYLKKGDKAMLEQIMQKAAPGAELSFTDVQPHMHTEKQAKKSPVASLFSENRARGTVLFWCAYFMGLLMIYGLNTWLPELMQAAGYDVGSSLTFLFTLNLAALFGSFILGRIADRVNIKKLLVVLYGVGVISMMMLSIPATTFVVYILVGFCGISVFGCQNVGTSFVANYYPSQIRSTGLGVCNTVGRLGGALAPTLGGLLIGAGLPMVFNCLAFAIPGVIAATCYGMVKLPKRKKS